MRRSIHPSARGRARPFPAHLAGGRWGWARSLPALRGDAAGPGRSMSARREGGAWGRVELLD